LIEGVDRFIKSHLKTTRNGKNKPHSDLVTVRFHIHPQVYIRMDEDGVVHLTADHDDSWAFSCADVMPQLEDSIFFAGFRGPVRSRQIVLTFSATESDHVSWRFTRTGLGQYV
jgi:uncharacterized heparinase superfamily protein